MSITGARPLGVTNCLNYGDPTRPTAFWQLPEGVRGLGRRVPGARPAGHRAATSRSTTSRPPGRSPRPPEIGVVGLLDDVDTARRPRLRTRPRRDRARRRRRPGPGRLRLCRASRVARARTIRRPSTSPARLRSRRSSARRSPAAWSPRRRTCRAAASPSRSPNARCGAVRARTVHIAVDHSPAVDLFGESPSRLVLTCRPRYAAALELLARQHGLPVATIGTVGGDRLVVELVDGGATGTAEDRGGGVADALEVPLRDLRHAWDHGLARAPRLGGLTACAACSGSSLPGRRAQRGRRDRGARPVRAPAPRPGIGRPGGQRRRAADALQGPRDDQLGPRRAAPAEPARSAGDRPLPLLDDRLDDLGERPADLSASGRAGRSRSATTATSSTRASCSTSSPVVAPGCPRRPTRSC